MVNNYDAATLFIYKTAVKERNEMNIEWKTSSDLVPLRTAIELMEQRVVAIYEKKQNQLIWLLEHPHVYSGGTSSQDKHLLTSTEVPIELTNRGGSYTYHGPGQRVVYTMFDLKRQGKDIRKFVWNLEQWIIDTLSVFGLIGERRKNRIGIWICPMITGKMTLQPKNELKIASIGLRVKNWVSYFGISVNLNPDLRYFNDIIACGNTGYGVTSFKQQGLNTSLTELDLALFNTFKKSEIAHSK